jgi:hypothetical protein
MGNTLDFTRRANDGKLNGISLASTKINVPKLPKFLQAVQLGANLRGCYFVDNIPKKDFFYYDLAWMKIPEGFSYVDYKFETSKNADGSDNVALKVSEPKAGMTATQDLLFPLVQLYDKADVQTESHICNVFAEVTTMGKGHPEGCLLELMAHRTEYVNPQTGGEKGKKSMNSFHLFAYNGALRLSSNDASEGGETIGQHYLVPFILSERQVVYFAFQLNDTIAVNELYKSLQTNGYFQAVDPLTINDQKGIFVTPKVIWAN